MVFRIYSIQLNKKKKKRVFLTLLWDIQSSLIQNGWYEIGTNVDLYCIVQELDSRVYYMDIFCININNLFMVKVEW